MRVFIVRFAPILGHSTLSKCYLKPVIRFLLSTGYNNWVKLADPSSGRSKRLDDTAFAYPFAVTGLEE